MNDNNANAHSFARRVTLLINITSTAEVEKSVDAENRFKKKKNQNETVYVTLMGKTHYSLQLSHTVRIVPSPSRPFSGRVSVKFTHNQAGEIDR